MIYHLFLLLFPFHSNCLFAEFQKNAQIALCVDFRGGQLGGQLKSTGKAYGTLKSIIKLHKHIQMVVRKVYERARQ